MKDDLIYSKLNDLAMLLIQIDVNDDGSLEALGNVIENIGNLDSLPDSLKEYFSLSMEEFVDIDDNEITPDVEVSLSVQLTLTK